MNSMPMLGPCWNRRTRTTGKRRSRSTSIHSNESIPGRYAREIATARTKVRDRQELKRALADGAKVDPHSDAERAYLRGMRQAQAGEPDAARRSWQRWFSRSTPWNRKGDGSSWLRSV